MGEDKVEKHPTTTLMPLQAGFNHPNALGVKVVRE